MGGARPVSDRVEELELVLLLVVGRLELRADVDELVLNEWEERVETTPMIIQFRSAIVVINIALP